MKNATIKHCSLLLALLAELISAGSLSVCAQSVIREEAQIFNSVDSITLAGTVTYPDSGVPKAAIVMATGSGAQNRDEELFGYKPFKTIAEYLTTAGYAVLRMDDRGTAESEGDFTSATTADFVTDIASGVEWMHQRFPHVPGGVLGHSEGGTIAIKEAVNDSLCKFIITLGAPAWAGDSIIMSQSRLIAIANTGRWDGETVQREILDIVKSSLNDHTAKMALKIVLAQAYGPQASLPQVKEAIDKNAEIMISPWYRAMLKYNPAHDIAKVTVPWLALNGSSDVQVLPENLETIKTLCPRATTVMLKNHNHLFQECSSGMPDTYSVNGDISPQTLNIIQQWLDSVANNLNAGRS